jgi:Fe-S cluster assembly ATP-binding protein
MLIIQNLKIGCEDKLILDKLSFSLAPGEKMALTGPNGSGKSSLANVLAGNPAYQILEGSITWQDQDLTLLPPEKRAQLGLFLAFQQLPPLPGLSVAHFLQEITNANLESHGQPSLNLADFLKILKEKMRTVNLPWEYVSRRLDSPFSGGERKRLELIQILLLNPKLLILDEVDSGLDQAGIELIIKILQSLPGATSVIVITHQKSLLHKMNFSKKLQLNKPINYGN